jgi:hypothetical protein
MIIHTPAPLSQLLKSCISESGAWCVKEYAHKIGIEYDLFRLVVNGFHNGRPRIRTLELWAEKMELDPRLLILTAFYEEAPDTVKPFLAAALQKLQCESSEPDAPEG